MMAAISSAWVSSLTVSTGLGHHLAGDGERALQVLQEFGVERLAFGQALQPPFALGFALGPLAADEIAFADHADQRAGFRRRPAPR